MKKTVRWASSAVIATVCTMGPHHGLAQASETTKLRYDFSPTPFHQRQTQERDIRDFAPAHPEETRPRHTIAAPESGRDLDSIGRDWAQRQTRLLAGGAEERVLMEFNRRIDGIFMRSIASRTLPRSDAPQPIYADDAIAWQPTSLHLSALNKFEMGFANRSRMSLEYTGHSLQWNLSRSLSEQFELNLRHQTERESNSLLLNYRW